MFLRLLTFSVAAAALFRSAYALPCNEAERYGILTFSNPIVLGKPTVFNADFTCSLEELGPPVFSDYVLQATADPAVPALLGFIPLVYFARRDVPASLTDTFNHTFDPTFFANYAGAEWKITLWTTRVELTDSVGSTLLVGGAENPATLVSPSD
ncbi:hypothetical protein BDP27DRAFT_1329697 [Rhodocollybia butyracea]|uniref:Uncharacterized protein n=1 Tax=Rhodocollybia butyracea TaxID=206335 RepID=A0A9P5PQX0_9AGAR|nr:hypothetical protein BDP27DRAFT_1329697 [Rhodocollybia butyracea]